MSDVAIKIENLSKQYRLGLVSTGTLSHDLNRWWHLVRGREDPYLKVSETNDRAHKGESEYVWALKDINLEVRQGEVLGIIGKNGAGKSTLLKTLSKVTAPTTGTIRYKGRIGSLLEVGTGFHQELTGRENIFLNGAILGMTKAEVLSKLDAIIDFSGVERYINTPVKRYSSGMMVRLGFAVAAYLEPDILVVDEVLAVGDAEFQKKAIGKMQDITKREGRTILFVSHNLGAIQQLCTSVALLADGILARRSDEVDQVIRDYTDSCAVGAEYQVEWENKDDLFANDFLVPRKMFFSDEYNNKSSGVLGGKGEVFINIELEVKRLDPSLSIGYSIIDGDDRLLYWSYHSDLPNDRLRHGANLLRSRLPMDIFNEGMYRIELCGGLHNDRWFFEPRNGNPYIVLTVEGKVGRSSLWNGKRPTVLAPTIVWEIVN